MGFTNAALLKHDFTVSNFTLSVELVGLCNIYDDGFKL